MMKSQSECLIPGLPNEVATICLAKLPLSFRHRISRVCRSWRNIFKEEYFWDVRREHSACETLLLVWTQNLYKNGVWHGFYPASGEWIRLPLMPRDNRRKGSSTFAVVDEKLFVIGGECSPEDSRRPVRSSAVSYFDLKRYEWQDTSPLNVGRENCLAAVTDNHLYVFGGLTNPGTDRATASTAEVYSPVTKTWKFISSRRAIGLVTSISAQGRIFAVTSYVADPIWKGAVYSPQEDEWTEIPKDLDCGWSGWPVEFNGLICIKRESRDLKETCVLGYNPSDNTWRLVHGQRVIENWFHPERFSYILGIVGQLLNLDGKLYKISRGKSEYKDEVKLVIRDLTNGNVVRKNFRPLSLAESEECQLLPPKHVDRDNLHIECMTVKLSIKDTKGLR